MALINTRPAHVIPVAADLVAAAAPGSFIEQLRWTIERSLIRGCAHLVPLLKVVHVKWSLAVLGMTVELAMCENWSIGHWREKISTFSQRIEETHTNG